jgi:hypothetical protein
MDAWSDPILWVAATLVLAFLYRLSRSIAGDLVRRRSERTKELQMARMLLSDYRARYGANKVRARLDEDLRLARERVEELGAKWKRYQRLKEEALKEMERKELAEEEDKIYRAFLAEAHRLKALKKAHELFKG